MPTSEQFKHFIKENGWMIAAVIFFIIWKFFLIHTLLTEDLNHPRFNDAWVYIQHIESVNQGGELVKFSDFILSFEGYGGFEHLTYRLIFGSMAYVLGISSTTMFILSFYIGIVILIPVLWIFLRQFSSNNRQLLAYSFFFFALFNGAGSYHGLFWVVPSFFALLLFLLIFSIILGDFKHWKIWIILLTPLILFTHFIGLYFAVIPILYAVILGILNRRLDLTLVKRAVFYLFITLLFYIPTAIHLHDNQYGGNAYGIEIFGNEVLKSTAGNQNKTVSVNAHSFFPGFPQIDSDYFTWLFPHWTATIGFFAVIFILFYYKQTPVLALYFSSLIFTLLSSMHIFGIRSLLLTWPVTYILYAYGSWFSFVFIRDIPVSNVLKKIFLWIAAIFVIVFIAINIVYSYSWNSGSNFSFKAFIQKI